MNIINVRLPGYQGLQEISVTQGTIERISPMRVFEKGMRSPDGLLDVGGEWLSLGGVDLQINGALGLAFPEVNLENSHKIPEISKLLWEQGVDGFLPTIVTTSVENIQRSLSIFADASAQQNDKTSAQILGVHLEGPFLNYQKRGAHPAEYLLPLTIDNVKRILGDYASIVKVITLAPELDDGEAIEYLRSLGITISLGHSQATETQAQRAFNTGATMVTHAFNAMPSLHHREPGLLGAAIVHPDVMCGLIADGQHVSPTMIKMLLCASDYEKGIFLVSDALSPLGLPDGIYPWDTRQIEVKNGTARLPDGTLSGTTLPLLVGVQNLVKWGICQIEDAIALATIAPRRAIGLLKEPSKRDRQKNNQTSPYLSQSAHQLLRWHLDESGELTWKRLQPRPVNGERL
ncbi:N-acetylglucosamine-6-phosphate deacetylase [Funiculus sociatus]|uniref:N-acetylglucosamine-6-phosphate deacetylase n=1 Tax=Funiculus sociatus TaxID=450527 RepID=UPI0032983D14